MTRSRSRPLVPVLSAVVVAALLAGQVPGVAQSRAEALHAPLDTLLDLYVRDGLVYYAALRADRARLDRYLDTLASADTERAYASWDLGQQAAFWINAYNAFVLRTVIDHYPIRGSAPQYPTSSIRQIPGAFDRLTHRAAGRTLTLDAIEESVLPAFSDPRLFLALGRGAVGSPRLRSEAYSGPRLETQLESMVAECPTRPECVVVDALTDEVGVTQVVGWHEAEFAAAYADLASGFDARSAIERAVMAFIEPYLFTTEREFLARNDFAMTYRPFDWTLNDLTGR